MSRIVIFANGVLSDAERVRRLIQPSDLILCADGGTRHALALGFQPELIIGDLDSMSEEDRKRIQSAGVALRPHSHDKNETDLELALQEALEKQPSSIVIVAALGRRLDHTIANIAMLTNEALGSLDMRLDDGLEEVFFCRGQAEVDGSAGDLVSLLPWGRVVDGIRTEGLRWPLQGESLRPEKTRGISNEMLSEVARVSILSGLLLIIHRRQTQDQNRAS
jgi:thiamine pyrophosphokinase